MKYQCFFIAWPNCCHLTGNCKKIEGEGGLLYVVDFFVLYLLYLPLFLSLSSSLFPPLSVGVQFRCPEAWGESVPRAAYTTGSDSRFVYHISALFCDACKNFIWEQARLFIENKRVSGLEQVC